MQPLPHHYTVNADDHGAGSVTLSTAGVVPMASAPPIEFDGPGDLWSPETLLLASVADCFVLSFRAVSQASKFDWVSIQCVTQGILDRSDRTTRFTDIVNAVTLRLAADASESAAIRLLEKADAVCLISNSLNVDVRLDARVDFET